MNQKKFRVLFSIFGFHLAFICQIFVAHAQIQPLDDRDSTALAALFVATDGENWSNKNNWLTENIRTWQYVSTNNDGRVTRLTLSNNNLVGELPDLIGQMDELLELRMGLNTISGTLPQSFQNLRKLRLLDLRDNNLNSIPDWIFELPSLREIYLNNNQIAQLIPDRIPQNSELRIVDLSDNRFRGDVPQTFTNARNLQTLRLGNNRRLVNLPDFSGSNGLQVLEVRTNKFDFGDLEKNMRVFPDATTRSRYVPQDSLYEVERINIFDFVASGQEIRLQSDARGTQDRYQWFKNGVLLQNNNRIQGATSRELVIRSPVIEDVGQYTCRVTNTLVRDLTLHRHPIFLYYANSDPFATEVPGRFKIDYISGCAPHTVTFTNFIQAQNVQYLIPGRAAPLSDPRATPGSTITYTFNQPGTYLITQVIPNNLGPPVNLEVRVFAPVAPEMSFIACSNNQVKVRARNPEEINYEFIQVNFGDGSTPRRMAPDEEITYTYPRSGNYTVTAKPDLINGNTQRCMEYKEEISVAATPPPALIKTIEAGQNEIMRLEIEGSRNYRYQLQMASNSSTNFQNVNTDLTDLSNIQIRSLDVRNSYYCFRVITLDECGSNNAQSAIFCSIATKTTAEHKVNLIEWNTEITPAGGSLTVIRDAQPIANFPANQQFYRDRDVLCNQFYRYQVRLETPLGQVSTSFGMDHFTLAFEKPDSVSGKEIAPSIEGIALAWRADPSNPAWYYIYRIESGQRTLVDSTRETSYVERGLVTNSPRVCYEITFKDDCLVESITGPGTCFSTGNNLVFPNAIMPDGSMAINREFKPIGEFFGRYTIIISNGYGEELFRSQEINRGWDGTHNGQPVPVGTYPYRVELVNLGGKRQTFSGTVTVVR